MPKISLESNCIRIELTAAEAVSYGFALNRPQLFRKTRSNGGGLLLELFSIDLTKTLESSEATALIPPALIYPGSPGYQAPSTARQGAPPVSSPSGESTKDSTLSYSPVSGYHPHGKEVEEVLMSSVTDAGNVPHISSQTEQEGSSAKGKWNLDAIPPPSPQP